MQLDNPPPSPIRIMGQYIKDLSFETPHAPDIFAILRTEAPEIPIGLDTTVRHMAGSSFEVTLSVQLEAVAGGKKAFILELAYAAVVEVNPQMVPQEHVHPILMIEVPRQLFPFVRQLVSEITANGGFPPLMLQIFDFADMYRKKFGEPGAQPAAEGGTEPSAVH
ncbi:MAG: protein-export chaperone SecB [Rhodospirillaceae bacterium]|nr:protein-export chaperone SecB [Rhodospirillaceae bacterium]